MADQIAPAAPESRQAQAGTAGTPNAHPPFTGEEWQSLRMAVLGAAVMGIIADGKQDDAEFSALEIEKRDAASYRSTHFAEALRSIEDDDLANVGAELMGPDGNPDGEWARSAGRLLDSKLGAEEAQLFKVSMLSLALRVAFASKHGFLRRTGVSDDEIRTLVRLVPLLGAEDPNLAKLIQSAKVR